MKLHKIVFSLCCALLFVFNTSLANPNEASTPEKSTTANSSAEHSDIRFKEESKSIAEQSLSTLLITIFLLGGTAAGLYYLRNYLQKKTGRPFIKSSAIAIKDRLRLSPKLSLYVVTYRDKEILVAQSGDAVTPLSEFPMNPRIDTKNVTDPDPKHHAHF